MKKLISKNEYGKLLSRAVEISIDLCQNNHKVLLSKNTRFVISLPQCANKQFDLDQILDIIFINEEFFYKSIDVFVKRSASDITIVSFLVSGHEPSIFDETWNPGYLGPFKPTSLEKIDF